MKKIKKIRGIIKCVRIDKSGLFTKGEEYNAVLVESYMKLLNKVNEIIEVLNEKTN